MELYKITTRDNGENREYLFLDREKCLSVAEVFAATESMRGIVYEFVIVERLKYNPNLRVGEFEFDKALAHWQFGKRVSVEV